MLSELARMFNLEWEENLLLIKGVTSHPLCGWLEESP
jgi:hypothetical protein